jgi:hypothetical protein
MTTPEKVFALLKEAQALRSRYHVVEVTDMRTRNRSYKIYRRGTAGREPPLVSGLPTRADAEAKVRELEAIEG